MTPLRTVALIVAAVSLAAPGAAVAAQGAAPGAPVPVSSHGRPVKGPLPRLVFFMNPYGAPCQMQDRILKEMGTELTERAEVVYYRTTEPSDLQKFREYGIRALPMILVTDPSGRELRRATPGILATPQVLKLLQP